MTAPSRAGRYRIEQLIGVGGFASVYLARDDDLRSWVAVKILADNWARQADVRERFLQEARLLRRADSHLLVQVFDLGELDDGRPYFVMTYADRGTLLDRLKGPAMSVDEALGLVDEICQGVAVLHSIGVVHRDLKPSNVLFCSRPEGGERVMVADLGIARSTDHLSGLTLPAGSPGYQAPEQLHFDGAPDARADVHGLGALTYHLLTGRVPAKPEHRVPPSALRPEVPEAVDAAVMRALDPDRALRWPDAAAYAAALSSRTPAPPPPENGGPPENGPPENGPPENGRPESGRPEGDRPDRDRPDRDRPDRDQPDRDQPKEERVGGGRRRALLAGGAAVAVAVVAAVTLVLIRPSGGAPGGTAHPGPVTGSRSIPGSSAGSGLGSSAGSGLSPSPGSSPGSGLGSSPGSSAATSAGPDRSGTQESTARWLREDSDIPREYRTLIVRAGTYCEQPGLSPALIAAMLKAESGYDPELSDDVRNEYGIARWTPEVLWHWQPGGLQSPKPAPPFSPELSILSMGRFLCGLGPQVERLPGDPALKLAALYRSGVAPLRRANGIPAKWRAYTEKVSRYMSEYRPA